MSTEATKNSADSLPDESIARDATSEPWPSPARAWYAVFVFALTLMINMLDRGIVPLLIGPLKRDLGLSDTQMGWLMGPAFIMVYMLLGLPLEHHDLDLRPGSELQATHCLSIWGWLR